MSDALTQEFYSADTLGKVVALQDDPACRLDPFGTACELFFVGIGANSCSLPGLKPIDRVAIQVCSLMWKLIPREHVREHMPGKMGLHA